MNIAQKWAAQLKEPSGIIGYLFAGFYLNWENRTLIRNTIDLLKVQPEDKILDIGFGGGHGIQLISKSLKAGQVTGLDISQAMVDRAQKKFANEIANGRIRLVQGSVSQLPFKNEEFEKICAIHTIYFWPDVNQALKEVHRVLKVGGQFAVSLHSKKKMQEFEISKHGFSLFTEDEIVKTLEVHGFSNISVKSSDLNKTLDSHSIVGFKQAASI